MINPALKVALIILLLSIQSLAQQWMTVHCESRFNISGMALVQQSGDKVTLVVVHDNKDQFADRANNPVRDKTERIGLVTIESGERPRYTLVKWLDKDGTEKSLPVDLESITSVPNQANYFMALVGNPINAEEKGKVYYLKLDVEKREARVVGTLKLPISFEGRDFEGFAVQKFGNRLYAIWADRGRNEKPSTLFWGELNLSVSSIQLLGQTEVKTPWPDLKDWKNVPFAETRSVSDLKVDSSGGLFVSSTLDSTDEGPFASAFYFAGTFAAQGQFVNFIKANAPIKLYQFKNYKIEAFEFVSNKAGGVVFGTDDENFGASIFINW